MFNYDVANNVLEIFKIPYNQRDTVYEESDNYTSYMKYLNETLKEDIKHYLIPEINKLLDSASEDDFPLSLESYRVVEEESYHGYKYYSVLVKLGGIGINRYSKEFCIMKMPYMDKYGIIGRSGKYYAMLRELVQDDDITFNKNVLKVITALGCFISLKASSKEPTITFRKKNLSSIKVLSLFI